MRQALACCMLLSAFLVGSVEGAGEDRYMVEMELWIDGELRGTPMVVVEGDVPASVQVDDADAAQGWRIELQVEPPALHEGAQIGSIWLHLGVHERRDGEWDALTDSLLGVREGRAATMSIVDEGVEKATPENSRLYLTARTSRLRLESSDG